MKIKNRNVSFLALALAGALSLVSLEGVYAVEKEEKVAKEDKEDKDGAVASKKKGLEETDRPKEEVSTKSKGVDVKRDSKAQKITIVKKEGDKVILKTPDHETITVDSKEGKVTAEDPASVVALLEVLGRGRGFDGVSADFNIPKSTIQGNVEFEVEVRERGFVEEGGNLIGRVHGLEIEEIVRRLPSESFDPTHKGGTGFTVSFTEIPPKTTRELTEVFVSEEFGRRREDIVFAQFVVKPMLSVLGSREGVMNLGPETPQGRFEFIEIPGGRLLVSRENNAVMMDSKSAAGMKKKLNEKGQELPSKTIFILPEGDAAAIEQQYDLPQFFRVGNGWRAYYISPGAIKPWMIDGKIRGGALALNFDGARDLEEAVNTIRNQEKLLN